jgi:hypothetical protein
VESNIVREGVNRRVNLELHDKFLKALQERCEYEDVTYEVLQDNSLDNKYYTIVLLGGIEAYELDNVGSVVQWRFIGYTNNK